MACIHVIKFTCDCCKKEFYVDPEKETNQKEPLRSVEIPSKIYDCEGRHYTAGITKVELCGKCFTEYWKYVQSMYEVTDYYGVTIKKLKEIP